MCSGFHTHMLSMWDCEAHYNLFWIDTSTSNTHKTWLDHKHSYQEYKMQCFFFACHHFQLQPNFYIAWISLAASRLFLYSQFNNLHVTASPDRTARLYFSLVFPVQYNELFCSFTPTFLQIWWKITMMQCLAKNCKDVRNSWRVALATLQIPGGIDLKYIQFRGTK